MDLSNIYVKYMSALSVLSLWAKDLQLTAGAIVTYSKSRISWASSTPWWQRQYVQLTSRHILPLPECVLRHVIPLLVPSVVIRLPLPLFHGRRSSFLCSPPRSHRHILAWTSPSRVVPVIGATTPLVCIGVDVWRWKMGRCRPASDNNAQVELDWHQGFEQCLVDTSISPSAAEWMSVCACVCVCKGHACHPSLSSSAGV